jgi:tRNA(fMet)-specific endonuclease VapC
MVMAGLEFGAEQSRATLGETKFSQRVAELRRRLEVAPLGAGFPQCYARVRSSLEAAGQKIGDRDTRIAAPALSLDAVLVTANVTEFARVSWLTVENWQG